VVVRCKLSAVLQFCRVRSSLIFKTPYIQTNTHFEMISKVKLTVVFIGRIDE
jgi:hypothetical protein